MKIANGWGGFVAVGLVAALGLGVGGAVYAQSGGNGAGGAQPSAANSGSAGGGGGGAATPAGSGLLPGAATVPGTSSLSPNASTGLGAGSTLSGMRANGTSLNASPNPRAPGLAGRTAPSR
nr:hypothetical protein HUO10_005445 [Paraburkholderia busanensis]